MKPSFFDPRTVLIAACGAIIITELFEWIFDKVLNASAGLVIGMAVACIIITVNRWKP